MIVTRPQKKKTFEAGIISSSWSKEIPVLKLSEGRD